MGSSFIHLIRTDSNEFFLFIIARTWKQPRCPSADEWIRKLWYIYTMEYYSVFSFFNIKSILQRPSLSWSLELESTLAAMLRIHQTLEFLHKLDGLFDPRNEFCMNKASDVKGTSPLCHQLWFRYISVVGYPRVWWVPLQTLTLIFQVILENT